MLKFTKRGNAVAQGLANAQPGSHPQLRTLGDLFPALKDTLTAHEYNMQRWAADRVASLFGIQRDQLLIDDLVEIDTALKEHLKHYSPQSVRSACNYVHRILRNAQQLGWQPANADIRAAWEEIL